MAQIEIKDPKMKVLAGLAVGVAVVGWGVFRLLGGGDSLVVRSTPNDDPVLREKVQVQLETSLPLDISELSEAVNSGDSERSEQLAAQVLSSEIVIESIETAQRITEIKGGNREVVVKVVYRRQNSESGGQPQTVYMLFDHSPLMSSWSYRYDTNEARYRHNPVR